jgi:hypothetical protein
MSNIQSLNNRRHGKEGMWPILSGMPFEIEAKEGVPPPDQGDCVNWNFLPLELFIFVLEQKKSGIAN